MCIFDRSERKVTVFLVHREVSFDSVYPAVSCLSQHVNALKLRAEGGGNKHSRGEQTRQISARFGAL